MKKKQPVFLSHTTNTNEKVVIPANRTARRMVKKETGKMPKAVIRPFHECKEI